MKPSTRRRLLTHALPALIVGSSIASTDACTRAVYLGPEDTLITVRSMDWASDLGSNLRAFPRGMNGPDAK